MTPNADTPCLPSQTPKKSPSPVIMWVETENWIQGSLSALWNHSAFHGLQYTQAHEHTRTSTAFKFDCDSVFIHNCKLFFGEFGGASYSPPSFSPSIFPQSCLHHSPSQARLYVCAVATVIEDSLNVKPLQNQRCLSPCRDLGLIIKNANNFSGASLKFLLCFDYWSLFWQLWWLLETWTSFWSAQPS